MDGMPAVDLRPLTDHDLPALSELLTALHPEQPQTAASLKNRQAFLSSLGEHHAWTLGWHGNSLVGAVETAGDHNHIGSGLFFLNVRVHPAWQDDEDELAGQLFQRGVETLRPLHPTGLRTRVHEHWPELAFYQNHGFEELERSWHSTLDLSTFDPGAFAARTQRARATVQLATLRELGWTGWDDHEESEGSVLHRYYTLVVQLLASVPFAESVTPWPFSHWQRVMRQRGMEPDCAWVAVAPDGRWAGLTELHPPDTATPGRAHQGLTGIVPAWRGQGLAWGLKVAATEWAKAQEWQTIATVNHTVNREMLGINAAMGFVRDPAELVLGRTWSDQN
ncbi:N-acetyltransferase [Deinococcus ruber]|uniref:N-acetyltransferase n=2 Tax=Deinococcus ruber TaxID=1848197 RepID=A0A918CPS2_9DEIO|nr:N-acetyltransferase [Deinococcus ruber]